MLEYLIILLITTAGMMRLTIWSAVAGAGALVLLTFLERVPASTSPRNLGGAAYEVPASASNLMYCFVAAWIAYLLGGTIGWLWGI